MRFHLSKFTATPVVKIPSRTRYFSQKLLAFARSIKAGFASVKRSRSPPPKFKRNSSYEDLYTAYLLDPFDGGHSSDITFGKSMEYTYPITFSGSSPPLSEGPSSSFTKASDILIGSKSGCNVSERVNGAPQENVKLNTETHVTLLQAERTPIHNGTGSTYYTDSLQAVEDEGAKEEQEEARAKVLLREDMASRWFKRRVMDEESYMKISKLHEVVTLPNLRKYSTVDGLHGPTSLGCGKQENGLSYGKHLPQPRTKSTIAPQQTIARLSPSATMVSPLYDILTELEEVIELEIAGSSEERSGDRLSYAPAVRGHRSSHWRMDACFDA